MLLLFVRWLTALCLTTLALGAAAATQGPCPVPGGTHEFPQLLGPAFERRQSFDYEKENLGYGCSVRYLHPSGMWADVYVYSAGHSGIPDTERDPWLVEQFKRTLSEIAPAWQHEKAKVEHLTADYERRGKAKKVEVMTAWADIESPKDGALRTHVMFWSGHGVIWKLRVTFPAKDREASEAAIAVFGDELVDLSRAAP